MSDKDYLIKGEMYQYNLGWLIKELLSFKEDLSTAIDLKTIKYADPIQWDITTQYATNTVVIDPKNGTAYMSKVPVPAGVELTNTNYWVVIFNYQDIYYKIMDGVAFNDRDQEYATKDLLVNDLVWYAGDLYRVTRDITTGSKYIPGTNLIKTTIESLLASYYGRDRITQVNNDTVNVSGDYTLIAGDIATTSDNLTQKVTKDREIDVDGSDSVCIDNASTLKVGGLRTEAYNGNVSRVYSASSVNEYNADKTDNYNNKHIVNGKDAAWIYDNLKTTLKTPVSIADLPTYAATANITIPELIGDDIVLSDIKCNLTIINCTCKSLTIQRSPNITINNITVSGGGAWGVYILDSTIKLGAVTISGSVTNSCIYADSSYVSMTNVISCNGATNFGLWTRNSYITAVGVPFIFSGTYNFLLYLSENSIGIFDTATVSGTYTARGYAVTSGAIANNGGDRYDFNNLFRDTVDNYISQPNVGGIVNNYPDYGITMLYDGALSGTEFISNNIGDAFNKITISIDGCTIAEGDELYIQIEDITGKIYDTSNWYVGAGTKVVGNTPTAFSQTGVPSTIVCEGGSAPFYVRQLLVNASGYTGTTTISNYGNGKNEFISATGVILMAQWLRKIHIKTKNGSTLNGNLKIGLEI